MYPASMGSGLANGVVAAIIATRWSGIPTHFRRLGWPVFHGPPSQFYVFFRLLSHLIAGHIQIRKYGNSCRGNKYKTTAFCFVFRGRIAVGLRAGCFVFRGLPDALLFYVRAHTGHTDGA